MFAAAVARNPDGDIIRYFDGRITLRELDELTDAFAAGIARRRVRRAASGWRIYLQNVPQFVIAPARHLEGRRRSRSRSTR